MLIFTLVIFEKITNIWAKFHNCCLRENILNYFIKFINDADCLLFFVKKKINYSQGRIQDFRKRGRQPSWGGGTNMQFYQISQKTVWNWENFGT